MAEIEIVVEILDEFRRILGLAPEDGVPQDLLDLYRTYNRRVSICSAGALTAKEYILLATIYESRKAVRKEITELVDQTPKEATTPPPTSGGQGKGKKGEKKS